MNRDRNKKVSQPSVVPDVWFDVERAAQYLSCSRSHIERACRERKIPYVPVGKKYVLKRQDLDAYMDSKKRPVAMM